MVHHHQPPLPRPGEQVECGDRGSALVSEEVLVDCDPGRVTVDRGRGVGEQELQRLRAPEQGGEGADDRPPAAEAGPSRVRTDGAVGVLPDTAHGVEVTGLERVVKGLVGAQDRVIPIDRATITARDVAYRPGPVDDGIRALSDDGSEVAAYDFGGEGEALLLAHATGFHAHLWLPVVAVLRPHFHCYAFDARGHGASGTPSSGDFDWRRSGDDARAVAAAFGLKQPRVAGHSGGAAALLLAEADRPGSWTALWLYEPVVPDWSTFPGGNPLVDGALRRRERFPTRDNALRNFAGKPPFDAFTPEALRLYVDYGFVDGPDGDVMLACRREDEAATYAGSVPADPRSRLREVHVPAHVACGGRGDHQSPVTMAAAVGLLPDGELEIMSGLGHFGPFEDPPRVARSIIAALT